MPSWFNNVLRNKFTTQEIANAWERIRNMEQADTEAQLAALHAISAAAHKGRVDEAERRALTPDECWGYDVLTDAGICPKCLYPAHKGTCEDAADGVE